MSMFKMDEISGKVGRLSKPLTARSLQLSPLSIKPSPGCPVAFPLSLQLNITSPGVALCRIQRDHTQPFTSNRIFFLNPH